jgi:adenosylmethionine-8-amino-7-oxononanoate aminotransferase
MVRVSGPNLILSPPLVITTDELEQLADMLEAAFDEAGAQRGAGA